MTLLLYCIICSYSHRTNYYSTNTIYYTKTILRVHLITEVPRISSVLYFAVISDSVGKKVLGDHLLTIAIDVLSNSAVKVFSALIFYFLGYLVFAILFLGYLDTTALSALRSGLVSTFYHSSTLVYLNYLAAELIGHRISS